ncbi:MAG: ABC transporter permease [Lachnospiraceae bacterium]|jgi:ABC-type antimicrobial peptide transport system permease subunit|nr:ABC transporter permease [Lachnospiraceae bacterium]
MKISDILIMGLKSLSRRKARTILTILGVVIGSLSIIIMRSIGYGMENNFKTQVMEQGGLTTITVSTYGAIYDDNGDYVDSKQQKLDNHLVEQIKQIEHVRAVTPVVQMDAALISGRYQGWTYITAMDMDSFDDFEFPGLTMGEYPTPEDPSTIIFGANTPDEFWDTASRGRNTKEIDLQRDKLTLKFQGYPTNDKKKEFTLPLKNIAKMEQTNGEFDYNTYMDMEYFKKIYLKYCNTLKVEDRKKAIKSLDQYQQIKLNVDNIDNVIGVQDEIKKLGFQSYSDMQFLQPLQQASETLQMVLGALGAVAMVVSAISIANTMVMSIYERTKEIGIMKVLGCVIKDIRKLFLFEAALIGLLGGIIGIILGYVASWLINKFGQPLFGALMSGNWMYDTGNTSFSIIPIHLPILALCVSVSVGLLSGYFPARRATKISAIEAMKTEG